MNRQIKPNRRFYALIRYAGILLGKIFDNKNILSLYLASMLFSLVVLIIFISINVIKGYIGINQDDWRMIKHTLLALASIFVLGYHIYLIIKIRSDLKCFDNSNSMFTESAELNKAIIEYYLRRRRVPTLSRIKAILSVFVVVAVSIFGSLEQQLLRSMNGIGNRLGKSSHQSDVSHHDIAKF